MRSTRVLVLPEPGPAMIRSGPSVWRTASCWDGFEELLPVPACEILLSSTSIAYPIKNKKRDKGKVRKEKEKQKEAYRSRIGDSANMQWKEEKSAFQLSTMLVALSNYNPTFIVQPVIDTAMPGAGTATCGWAFPTITADSADAD